MSPTDSTRPPVMAQKMLLKSREAESVLADALTLDSIDNYNRIPGKGDHSDDSENSSICSERSIDGYRRASDVSENFIGSKKLNNDALISCDIIFVTSIKK